MKYLIGLVYKFFISFSEFDLRYPEKLHDLLNDYALAGGKVKVIEEILSEHQLQIIEDNNFSLSKNKNLFLI